MRVLSLAAVFWAIWTGVLLAQTPEQGIIVTGEGRVVAPPDVAFITLGVTENADTAKAAMASVTASVAGLLAALDDLGVAATDRQTSGFYLQPINNSAVSSSSASDVTIGYRAGNSVTVRVRDLTRLGEVMDAVIELGANNFNGLRFDLQDTSQVLEAARIAAVQDAMGRARQLADAAGLNLGSVLRMTENSHHGGPTRMALAESRMSVGDAIASGEVEVAAQVTMVFAIAPGLQ